ncbi:replicative DNA helicase [Rhodoferax lacus]|uniref:Replicative DNA helicase n=1 Tax=Rhodoferax lacus TaxID=2184758 RepID=A0A3E1R639_9BURK|nr:replicative DNA helicase [Rhodoferax lacus]RFO94859.1 replicative DNA helicase [Rhodoferax lacus]
MSDQDAVVLAKLRVPPQAVEAEASLLGALLLNNANFELIADLVVADDFYLYQNQTVFRAISELVQSSRPADVITTHAYIQSMAQTHSVEGIDYLNALAQYVPSTSNIRNYAELVRERSILRQLVQAGDAIAANAFNAAGQSSSSVLEHAERLILSVGARGHMHETAKALGPQIARFLSQLQERADCPGQKCSVQTGFTDLDQVTDGFQSGDLVVIAGRPSMGKTSIAMNIAEHCAIRQKLPVLVFSLEMSADQLTQRIVGSVGRVNQKDLRSGMLSEHEWGRVSEAVEGLRGAVLDIQDMGVDTVAGIRTVARRTARRHKGLGLMVVDYLQLLGVSADRSGVENRANEVAQISRGLKLLAKELQCPVIALSQLNRSVESRIDKRPLMSDLRDSGAIEQDADTILFVYRDEVYSKEACKDPGVAEIIIGKQRNGPTGTVRLAWSPTLSRFDNLVRPSS